MIPKTIHYCWFGGGKKGKLSSQCFESWQKYFTDYQIIEWNEHNFDVNYNDYTKEAYASKKYAFVSDVARLVVLYQHGGIYFDTDVEAIKPFPEEILREGYFAEEEDGIIATGLGLSVPAKNKAIGIMLDDYSDRHFLRTNGSFDMTPCPIRNSAALERAGYKIEAGGKVAGIKVYGNEYFCGYDYKNHCDMVSDKTLSIHHYAATWENGIQRRMLRVKSTISGLIGRENYKQLRELKYRHNSNDKLRV